MAVQFSGVTGNLLGGANNWRRVGSVITAAAAKGLASLLRDSDARCVITKHPILQCYEIRPELPPRAAGRWG